MRINPWYLCALAGSALACAASAQPFLVQTDFEGIASASFMVGTSPTVINFTGGAQSMSVAPPLAHSGTFAWVVSTEGQSEMLFNPATKVGFWARESGAQGVASVHNPEGDLLQTIQLTNVYTQYVISGVGVIGKVVFTSVGAGVTVVDDFGFDPAPDATDPVPTKIPKIAIRVELDPVVTGMRSPIGVENSGDGSGRVFIVEQHGVISSFVPGSPTLTTFLDIQNRLVPLGVGGTGQPNDFDERGLLGLAFHPQFAMPGLPGFGKLYTYSSEPVSAPADFTTADPPPPGQSFNHQGVIAEWQTDATLTTVVLNSRREMMRFDEPQFNHNGGQISFGPEGLLYIALGDGGGADDRNGQLSGGFPMFGHGLAVPGPLDRGNGQNTGVIYGKILRINVNGNNSGNGQYGIPATNPFVNGGGLGEIYAYGLRNPFRFSFDAQGRLIVADVGQRDLEEINIVESGDNCGWRYTEGNFRFLHNGNLNAYVTDDLTNVPAGLVGPVAEYDHDEGISIIGGYDYHGSIGALHGHYVFGDFSTSFGTPAGRLFVTDLDVGEISELVIGKDNRPLGLFLKAFGVGEDSELYMCAGTNSGPFGNLSSVYKFVPVCYADCDGSGSLDFFDFLCFQNAFQIPGGAVDADCNLDGSLDFFDFLCFQNEFAGGCP